LDQDRSKKMQLSTQAYLEAVKALQSEADPFLHPKYLRKNVKGLGVGVKWVKGQPTGEPALIVFVTEKVNREQLTSSELVPQELGDMQTDVLAVGEVWANAMLGGRVRPLAGGYSVGRVNGGTGTIATCVTDLAEAEQLGSGSFYLLSNNHVIAASNQGVKGDPIIQPGAVDGGRLNDVVGYLARFVPIQFEPPIPRQEHQNLVDAALAETKLDVSNREIHWIGYPQGWRHAEPPDVGSMVQKTGRTTGYTIGRIIALDAIIDVNYSPTTIARFSRQIMTTAMSAPGDSGSLVLDLANRVVGLLFAGSDKVTVVNPITPVRELLKVEL